MKVGWTAAFTQLTLRQNRVAPPTKSRDPEVRHEKMASASKYGGLADIPIDFGEQYCTTINDQNNICDKVKTKRWPMSPNAF